jgi:hypothetical protein
MAGRKWIRAKIEGPPNQCQDLENNGPRPRMGVACWKFPEGKGDTTERSTK